MSAARLTTPKPTTARHGDHPGAGAGPSAGAAAWWGDGSALPGVSDTPPPLSSRGPPDDRVASLSVEPRHRAAPRPAGRVGPRGVAGARGARSLPAPPAP